MHKVDVKIRETARGEQYNLTLTYNQSPHLSESTFGFERRMFIEQKRTSVQIFEDTPSLTHFKGADFRKYKYIETESLFDFYFQCGLARLMLVRDNQIFRLIAWGCNSIDKYRLYTRSWEQFCKSVARITEGRLTPTNKLWSGGYIINVVGPDIKLPFTPLTDAFENDILETVRNRFNDVIKSGVYGFVEADLYSAQADIENTIGTLHNAVRRFTPSTNNFESEFAGEIGLSDFQI